MNYKYYIGKPIFFIKNRLKNYLEKRFLRQLQKKHSKNNVKRGKPRLFWGPIPIKNNCYFSEAMRGRGYNSDTVMTSYFESINKKEDYDLYTQEILDSLNVSSLKKKIYKELLVFEYCIDNYDVFHISFLGGILGFSKFKSKEAEILKACGKKVVLMAYGGDFYRYSRIKSVSLQHVLQLSYPYPINREYEEDIHKRVIHWEKNADFILGSLQSPHGASIWHNLPCNYLSIDTIFWKKKIDYSNANGITERVKVIHTPNHKGFKGTEFLMKAIEDLKEEGFLIELILLEGIQNSEVQKIMFEKADILAEQLILGYGLSGVEGMATGLPVLSNLDDGNYTRVFRRYSYLNECPILSTTPETIKENLRVLIKSPKLRKELGQAGRKYVEKYHSYKTAQYMFSLIYDKIWYDKDVDTMNMYHPLNPDSYNNQSPIIEHPLVENKLPEQYDSK